MVAPFSRNITTGLGGVAGEGTNLFRQLTPYVDDAAAFAARNGSLGPTTDGLQKHAHRHAHRRKPGTTPDADDVKNAAAQQDVLNKAPVALTNAVLQPEATALDKGVATVGRVLNFTGMLPLLAMAPAFVGGAVSGIGGWIGKNMKWEGLTNATAKFDTVMKKPQNYLHNNTVADVAEKVGVRSAASRSAQFVADKTASPVDWIARKSGFAGWQRSKHIGKAQLHFEKAQKLASGLSFDNAPAELKPHFEAMREMTTQAHTVGHIDRAKFEGATKAIENAVKNNGELAKAAGMKEFGKLSEALGPATYHHARSEGMRDVKKSWKTMPDKLGKVGIGNTVMNGSFITLSAISMFQDWRAFKRNLQTLKQMNKDMTGKETGTLGILLGNVPSPLKDARSHMLKNLFLKEGTDAIGMAVNIKQATNPHFSGMKALAAYTLPQMIAQGADAMMGRSVPEVYREFIALQSSGQQMTPEIYAAFVSAVSPEIRARGGAADDFALALGKEYAEKKASAADILKDVDSGAIMAKVHEIIAAADAKKAAHPADAAKTSHVEKLTNGKAAAGPVVGDHTDKLAKAAAQPQVAGPAVS